MHERPLPCQPQHHTTRQPPQQHAIHHTSPNWRSSVGFEVLTPAELAHLAAKCLGSQERRQVIAPLEAPLATHHSELTVHLLIWVQPMRRKTPTCPCPNIQNRAGSTAAAQTMTLHACEFTALGSIPRAPCESCMHACIRIAWQHKPTSHIPNHLLLPSCWHGAARSCSQPHECCSLASQPCKQGKKYKKE